MILVLMGVSGSGKSTVGKELSSQLHCPFEDGDDYHPASNKTKMASGVPLNDEDRYQWLMNLHSVINRWQKEKQRGILVCSALKRKYRRVLAFGSSASYFDTSGCTTTPFQGHSGTVPTDFHSQGYKEAKSEPITCTTESQGAEDDGGQKQSDEQCGQSGQPLSGKENQSAMDRARMDGVVMETGVGFHHHHVSGVQEEKVQEHQLQRLDAKSTEIVSEREKDVKNDSHNSHQILFVHLKGSFEMISSRLCARKGHFFNPSLLKSQFDTLEDLGSDENGLVVDIAGSESDVVSYIVAQVLSVS